MSQESKRPGWMLLRGIYNLLFPFLLLLALPSALRKHQRRGGSWLSLRERLGMYDKETLRRVARMTRPLWLHAVSVGEVLVAEKLITAWRLRFPHSDIVLTVTTNTGRDMAAKKIPSDVLVIFSPLDVPWVLTRVFEVLRPSAIVLVEAEMWPNLVHFAKREGLPLILTAARLSPRSERRYVALRKIVQLLFSQLDLVQVPEPTDAARWQTLGVPTERLTCTGSVKHDDSLLQPDPRMAQFRNWWEDVFGPAAKRVILLASSHSGEERALVEALRSLGWTGSPDQPALALVPRHFERAAALVREMEARGVPVILRSAMDPNIQSIPATSHVPVFIIDSTGELRAWQALASVVIVGKSFLAHGGQNPVEALQVGCPVIMGPHMENFTAVVEQMLSAGAALQVSSIHEAAREALRLIAQPASAQSLTQQAHAVLLPHRGAATRSVQQWPAAI